ncbi:kin of IRRE-like protein 3 [Ptychodera flava]|uniref:kin of IRRE-like protein 3 n=1 Tax=Ptychodera flava TaxID=63121 RepID=UPI003969C22E
MYPLDFRNATAFILKPVDTLVLAGDSTQLNCIFDVAPVFKAWYRGNRLIALGEDIEDPYTGHYEIVGEGNVYNLRIHNTASDDGGEYECTDILNRSRTAMAFLYVIIDSRTKCSVKNDSTVITGADVSFNCKIELDDNAPGDLVWYSNGNEVSRTSGNVNVWNTTLYEDDNGAVFSCQLEHNTLPPPKWSELACEETIVMDVQYPPDIEITDKIGSTLVETTVEGDSYFAHCKVDANPVDNLNVQWQYGHITVHDGALLELQNVNRNQGGL